VVASVAEWTARVGQVLVQLLNCIHPGVTRLQHLPQAAVGAANPSIRARAFDTSYEMREGGIVSRLPCSLGYKDCCLRVV